MEQCDNCYHRAVCIIRKQYGMPQHQCQLFSDFNNTIGMYLPLGSTLWVIENQKIWKGSLEKITIQRNVGTLLEVKMPKEMPEVSSIEYSPDDFGVVIFLNEEAANDKLKKLNAQSQSK
jgi:hypothetical protein